MKPIYVAWNTIFPMLETDQNYVCMMSCIQEYTNVENRLKD